MIYASIPTTLRYKVRVGEHRLYAVGAHGAVIRALCATFTNHGMQIHQEKGSSLIYFPGCWLDVPGGWLDRASSALCRAEGFSPRSNSFTATYEATNNPLVTLVTLNFYHKTSFMSDRRIKSRISRFFSAFQQESAMADVALVGVEDWPSLVRDEPQLRCSPLWLTEAEIQAEMKKIDPNNELDKLRRKL